MHTFSRFLIATSLAIVTLTADVTLTAGEQPLSLELRLVPEAHAVYGRQRRTRRRGVAVGYAAGTAQAEAEAEEAQEQAPPPSQPAAPPPEGGKLPIGRVVTALPAGCVAKTIDGVEYQHCGSDYYRAAFQGNQLVYVTSQP